MLLAGLSQEAGVPLGGDTAAEFDGEAALSHSGRSGPQPPGERPIVVFQERGQLSEFGVTANVGDGRVGEGQQGLRRVQ